jgi:hypothetical protein
MAYGVLQRRAVKRPLPAQRHYAAWTSHVQRATNKKRSLLGCRGKKKDNKEKEKKGKEKKEKKRRRKKVEKMNYLFLEIVMSKWFYDTSTGAATGAVPLWFFCWRGTDRSGSWLSGNTADTRVYVVRIAGA